MHATSRALPRSLGPHTEARLRGAIVLIGLAGFAVAGYLTWVHYAGGVPVCLASGGCERVQSSRYAELGGVPVALVGLVGYAAIVAGVWLPGEPGRSLPALLALIGFGFSAYLTYLELFTIRSICQWCLASAILMSALAVLTIWRVLRSPVSPTSHPREPT